MTTRKQRLTVTVDPDLVAAGHRAVAEGGADSLSGWVSTALADKVRRDRQLAHLRAAIADHEAEFGEITIDEIAAEQHTDRVDAIVVRGRSPGARGANWKRGAVRVTLVLDTGALIALERNERPMWVRLKAAEFAGEPPVTHGGVLGQVWRGGQRQARLARALQGLDVHPLDRALGRSAGELLGKTGSSDVIDAAVVLLAADGDEIVTLDRHDFESLVAAAGQHVELIHP